MAGTSSGPMPGGFGAKKPKQAKGDQLGNPLMDLFDLMFPGSAAMGGGETTTPKGGDPQQTVGVARKQGKAPAPPAAPGQPPSMMAQPTQTVQARQTSPAPNAQSFWGNDGSVNMEMGNAAFAPPEMPMRNPVFQSDASAFGPGFNALPASPPLDPQSLNPAVTRPPMPTPGAPPVPQRNPAFSGAGDPMEQMLMTLLQSGMGQVPEANPNFHPQPGEQSSQDLSKFFMQMTGGM